MILFFSLNKCNIAYLSIIVNYMYIYPWLLKYTYILHAYIPLSLYIYTHIDKQNHLSTYVKTLFYILVYNSFVNKFRQFFVFFSFFFKKRNSLWFSLEYTSTTNGMQKIHLFYIFVR